MRVRWMLVSVLTASLALGVAGCSDDDENQLLPCPEAGLGVNSARGVPCNDLVGDPAILAETHPQHDDLLDCQQQLREWNTYDCRQPQFWIDQGAWQNIAQLDPSGQPLTLSFIVTNASKGSEKLILSDLRFTGDEQCMIRFNPSTDVESLVVDPGESIYIQGNLIPDQLGETHGHFRFNTNAQNYTEVVLPVCARIVEESAPAADAGASGADGGTSPPVWWCNDDPDPQVYACHE